MADKARKPDYDRIATLEIELQDGPAWDRLQEERNREEFFRQIAYDTWRQQKRRGYR